MKSKNGFTMIELLAVILILSMVMLVSLPALLKTLQNTDEKELENFNKTVFLAAESYFQRNIDNYPQLAFPNGKGFVSVDILISEGYLKQTMIDPNTQEPINTKASIQATVKIDGSLEYEMKATNLSHTGYTTTGLVAMYDAITKLNGNRLTDLSGNKYDSIMRGTNNNNRWDNNKILYNGTDNLTSQAVPTIADFTIEIVFSNNLTANDNTNAGMYSINTWTTAITDDPAIILNYNKSLNNISFKALAPATTSIAHSEKTLGTVSAAALERVNTYAVTKRSGSINIYLNNNLIQTFTDTAFISRFNLPIMRFTIGTWNNYYAGMEMYAFRIYNKALSTEEVAHNFNLDQTRF